jgi:hypothetical protein
MLAPVFSQIAVILLIEEIHWAKKELATILESSLEKMLVVMSFSGATHFK